MIRIIAVGNLKEAFFEGAVREYAKRLSAYTRLEIIQVPDEKCNEKTLAKEAESIRKKIRDTDYVITLEIQGKRMTSEGFAKTLEDLALSGRSDITFVIGGSMGLAESIRSRSNLALSFSDMTFPHQLMRVILLEQIYRAYKINRGEPYHK